MPNSLETKLCQYAKSMAQSREAVPVDSLVACAIVMKLVAELQGAFTEMARREIIDGLDSLRRVSQEDSFAEPFHLLVNRNGQWT